MPEITARSLVAIKISSSCTNGGEFARQNISFVCSSPLVKMALYVIGTTLWHLCGCNGSVGGQRHP